MLRIHIIHTVVWGKFTVEFSCEKFVHGKILLSLGVSDETFLTTNYF